MLRWTVTGSSSANTAKTITKAAVTNRRHFVTGFEVALSAAAATGDVSIQLQDGTSAVYQTYIGDSAARGTRVVVNFKAPLPMTRGNAANLVVGAAGAAAITNLNLLGFLE